MGARASSLGELVGLASGILLFGPLPLQGKENYDKSRQSIKKQRHHFADKGLYSQRHGFSRSHVWMCDS